MGLISCVTQLASHNLAQVNHVYMILLSLKEKWIKPKQHIQYSHHTILEMQLCVMNKRNEQTDRTTMGSSSVVTSREVLRMQPMKWQLGGNEQRMKHCRFMGRSIT